MGLPQISASGFPSKRVDPYRAGITARTFTTTPSSACTNKLQKRSVLVFFEIFNYSEFKNLRQE